MDPLEWGSYRAVQHVCSSPPWHSRLVVCFLTESDFLPKFRLAHPGVNEREVFSIRSSSQSSSTEVIWVDDTSDVSRPYYQSIFRPVPCDCAAARKTYVRRCKNN
eukprot:TRINITY_DN3502_c0_g1_i2.p1 TRINITY_DN3502_c0_g1~~TRINITY_DN3502_c0_g1_i2.p1  ORF type:complete len:105 (+),score=5.70 TRINITY_DN3502_c0_g1_i2:124-438(+)